MMELLSEASISRRALSRPCVTNATGEIRSALAGRSPARDADHLDGGAEEKIAAITAP
jgi:hypothetical protein